MRVYEAVDVMDLACWSLSEEFLVHKAGVSCIAWNQSGGRTSDEPPALVVGSGETTDPTVKVWLYNESNRSWRPTVRRRRSGAAQPAATRSSPAAPEPCSVPLPTPKPR